MGVSFRNLASRLWSHFKKPSKAQYLKDAFPEFDIGAHSYGGLNVRKFDNVTNLHIGKYCSFAADIQVMLGGEHRMDWVTTYPFNVLDARHSDYKGHPATKGDVHIGNDVWIGREAIIMSGVTIGDGAVIAARAVVVKDVAPYSIVGGNPAKQIRLRFDEDTITRLLAVAWWDWPEERINKKMSLLLQSDIQAFLKAAEAKEI